MIRDYLQLSDPDHLCDPTADLHMHTIFSDGENTPEEMIEAALKKSMSVMGISDHSYTFFDESYCMPKDRISDYKMTINSLKKTCPAGLSLLLGIEQDYYSAEPTDGYDYVIGSVHYIRIPLEGHDPVQVPEGCFACQGFIYIPVDETPDILKAAADLYFDRDIMGIAELYYSTVSDVAEKTGADIIGHFDLISKFNDDQSLFSFKDPRYIAAWKAAAEKLAAYDVLFEINTGAIAKGYRTCAYPSPEISAYIAQLGGSFIRSSDAHRAEHIAYGFI